MNTKLVMTASALYLAVLGIAATFLPQEILAYLGGGSVVITFVIQLTGAAYLALAMLDWMAKESVMGGIYNRPIVTANTVQYTVGALALVKGMMAGRGGPLVWTLGAGYALFAVLFAMVMFGNPVKLQTEVR